MDKISEVDSPVVGKHYLVPCVERRGDGKPSFWPVLGDWHEDAAIIGFKWHHYHYDARFLTGKQLRSLAAFRSESYALVAVFTNEAMRRDVSVKQPDVVFKRRRMQREMPDFPSIGVDGNKVVMASKIEEAFKDVKMTCMTCPHRGFRLTGLPVKDGMVICNGHGLRWNVTTGEMVPR